jgi:hypothetical protein
VDSASGRARLLLLVAEAGNPVTAMKGTRALLRTTAGIPGRGNKNHRDRVLRFNVAVLSVDTDYPGRRVSCSGWSIGAVGSTGAPDGFELG